MIISDKNMKCSTKEAALRKEPHTILIVDSSMKNRKTLEKNILKQNQYLMFTRSTS